MDEKKIKTEFDIDCSVVVPGLKAIGDKLEKNNVYKYIIATADGNIKIIRIILNRNIVLLDKKKVNKFIVKFIKANKDSVSYKFGQLIKTQILHPLRLFTKKLYSTFAKMRCELFELNSQYKDSVKGNLLKKLGHVATLYNERLSFYVRIFLKEDIYNAEQK